jgi:hypothetical protein
MREMSSLAEDEQDTIGALLIAYIRDVRQWEWRLAQSRSILEELIDEALTERAVADRWNAIDV